jgi:hypothetical protein
MVLEHYLLMMVVAGYLCRKHHDGVLHWQDILAAGVTLVAISVLL